MASDGFWFRLRDVFSLRYWTTIIRWCLLALHFPTRQIETLEENGQASQIERARAQFKVKNTQLGRLKTLEKNGRASQIERARA